MNKAQLEHRLRAHKAWGEELKPQLEAVKTKAFRGDATALKESMTGWMEEKAILDRAARQLNVSGKAAKVAEFGASAAGHGPDEQTETKAIRKAPSVLSIPEREWKNMHEAMIRRQSMRVDTNHLPDVSTKAPFGESNFASGNLPAILLPQLTLDLPYEPNRAFSNFTMMTAPQARALEYVQHTGNTNPAGAVAELGNKPDVGMQLTTVTTAFTKIAATATFSHEALYDFSEFMRFVPAELQRAVLDAENAEVISGSGVSPHMLGILNTSGTLTRAIGADTPLDCVRKAINDIRVGSSFAKADLIITHPTTMEELTLQKATTNAYVLNPNDPNLLGGVANLWGVKCVISTACPAGTMIVCDSQWIYAWTRQALTLDMNAYGVDANNTNLWIQNAVSFRAEERIAVGCARPTSINIVTGLPAT